jgi:predicted transposase YbfD/YdcC
MPSDYLLSISTHESGETLVQAAVTEKTNEIPVAHEVLPLLPLAGRVCTADALHTHHELATRRHFAAHPRDALRLLLAPARAPG